jgi:EmrB/QacA subfamily drug resistance transporter
MLKKEVTLPDTSHTKWWTLVAVCAGVFMLLLDITIVNVALPQIQNDFSASLADLQWVLDAYALTLAAFLLTAGSIGDARGHKRVFAAGLVIFTTGSILCGAAPNALFLSLARAFQGIGGAIMFATALALIANAFAPRERGVAFGVFGAVTGVAVAVGPVLGGALTSGLSWRWIFFVNVPVGLAALAVTIWGVAESRTDAGAHVDWAGCATFSIALAALVYGLIRSHPDGWGSPGVWGSLVLSGVMLVTFVVVERRMRNPMFDFSLLRVPTFSGGLIAAWAISASLFSLLTYIVIYLQAIQGYSALQAGLRFLPLTLVIFLVAGVAGRLSSLMPIRWLIGPGFLLIAVGLLVMRGNDPTQSWTHLVPGFVIAGVGAGLVNTPLASTAVGVVEPRRAGMASGVNSTFRQVGIATGIALLGSILSSQLRDSVVATLSHGPLAPQAARLADAVSNGQFREAVASVAPSERGLALGAAANGYASALNDILLIGGIVALAAAVLTAVLIRSRDFVHAEPGPSAVGEPVVVAG